MRKSINVRVTTADAELEFVIKTSTTGQQVLDHVFNKIGLQEIWFFGLQYTDVKNRTTWLKLKKKVTAQEIKKESPFQFKLRSKFFPENVVSELTQEVTQRLFFLQVQESILSEELFCSPDTSVLLASYAAQVKYGIYKHDIHVNGYISNDKLLPEGFCNKNQITKEQLEERITTLWSKHTDISRQGSMMEYLKIAQDLEMFGVNYFEIKNKSGNDLILGINALGVNVYEPESKLKPKINYYWTSIQNLSFNGKKFYIKFIDRNASEFIFYVSCQETNKHIMSLCMDNYELYLRRRKPLTEVLQIKSQMKDKNQEWNKDAESEKVWLEFRLRKFEEEARVAQEALEKAKKEAEILKEKKRQTEEEAHQVRMLQLASEEARLRLEQEAKQERLEKLEFERRSSESSAEIQRLLKESEKLKLLLKSKLHNEEQQTKTISSVPTVVLQTNKQEENNNSILLKLDTDNMGDYFITNESKVENDGIMVRTNSVSSADLPISFVSFIYKEIY